MDPNGAITSWNVGAEHLFGYAEGEIIGRSADAIFTPEDRAAGALEDERRRARADGRAEDERWHLREDGSRFWASGLLMPLEGGAAGFVKIARDRTERHRAEERLRESEERFRLLATSIPQLVFLSRPDGARTWPSPQWIDFTGVGLRGQPRARLARRDPPGRPGGHAAALGRGPRPRASTTSSTASGAGRTAATAGTRRAPGRWTPATGRRRASGSAP
jgi:PAS domain S-box-containing protein